jgi:hypothetical protein
VDYILRVGDSTNDGMVLNNDCSAINAAVPCLASCGDQNRLDITGDNRILVGDISAAVSRVFSLPVAKPTGHGCIP